MSIVLCNFMLRWWVGGGGGTCGFPRGAGCVGAEFIPIVAVIADEFCVKIKSVVTGTFC